MLVWYVFGSEEEKEIQWEKSLWQMMFNKIAVYIALFFIIRVTNKILQRIMDYRTSCHRGYFPYADQLIHDGESYMRELKNLSKDNLCEIENVIEEIDAWSEKCFKLLEQPK